MRVAKEQRFSQFERIDWEDLGGGVRRKVLAYGDDLMAICAEFKRSAVGARHTHPHVQVTYIRSGRFSVHIGGVTRELGAGDVYYIPSNVEHGVEALEDSVLIDVFTPMRKEFVRPEA